MGAAVEHAIVGDAHEFVAVVEDFLEAALWHFFAAGADDEAAFAFERAAKVFGDVEHVVPAVDEDFELGAHGVPVDGRGEDHLIVFGDFSHEGQEVVVAVVVVVVVGRQVVVADVDDAQIVAAGDFVYQLACVAVASRTAEDDD